ncbi:MAG: SGNH/GDSL hydrolase family protein [Ilumatobacteraceae bacterium]
MGRVVVFIACFALTLELATRLDQKITFGAPLWGKYTYASALYTEDEFGILGKPNAVFEKWQLNSFGFRGPEIALAKAPGSMRIACFGASETFGLYEKPDNDWPRQLERELRRQATNVEVMNVALAGMSLSQRVNHFQHRVVAFHPDLAILMLEFPSYAGMTSEKLAARNDVQANRAKHDENAFTQYLTSWRFVTKLKNAMIPKLPEIVQDSYRAAEVQVKLVAAERALGSKFRSFRQVMPLEVETFQADIQRFHDMAMQNGVTLLLVSPAYSINEETLRLFYTSWPYIDETWLREAQRIFTESAKRFAEERHIPFVDFLSIVSGREAQFMRDEVHFSDDGAEAVGKVIAREVLKIIEQRNEGSRSSLGWRLE